MRAGSSLSTRTTLTWLRRHESQNVTHQDPAGGWPIVWERAQGVHVWDPEGRRYLDLTSAFGVCAAGHAHPAVVEAARRQLGRLGHAMGDVHPHPLKARLARELSRITFERWQPGTRGKVIFCNSGFEAVEAALKTALLATGRPEVAAFEGGYHGLGYGALNVTHRREFRAPFTSQLGRFGRFFRFPADPGELERVQRDLEAACRRGKIGALLVEPIQGRGGIRIPAPGFLRMLREVADRHGICLVVDEILTGFGRTGRWFACEREGVVPDLVCLGKAMSGGFPISACVGRSDRMDAWPPTEGEAMHTSTFLGHPVGCAMALAQIRAVRPLLQGVRRKGRLLMKQLGDVALPGWECRARGEGLLAGLELRRHGRPATALALRTVRGLLRRGVLILPEGAASHVLAFMPPYVIGERDLSRAVHLLQEALLEAAEGRGHAAE